MIRSMIRSAMMVTAFAVAITCPARAGFVTVNSLSDVVLWAGTGSNEAGFVLQFTGPQSPTTVAWAYRWDGSATVQDMMFALAGSTTVAGGQSVPPGLDNRLSLEGAQYDFGGGPVVFLSTIRYAQAGLPPEWSQVDREIIDDYVNSGTYPSLYSNAGAGGVWTGPNMSFGAASVGISELLMVNGGWYGFAQTDGTDPYVFSQPVSAVPEPGTWALGAGAIVVGFMLRRRARRTP